MPPDEGGARQDSPRTDWHLNTPETRGVTAAYLRDHTPEHPCLTPVLTVSPVPTATLVVLLGV